MVDNKPGAGAIIAIDAVAKSPPDGYTLLMTTSGTVWQNRVLYTKLPYNLDKDLAPIAFFPSGPLIVGVPEKLGMRNFRELIAIRQAKPHQHGQLRARLLPADGGRPDQPQRRHQDPDRSTTAAKRPCGSIWPLAKCRWPLAATSPSPL